VIYEFILSDNSILVDVLIDNISIEKNFVFILDTGAIGSSINKVKISKLDIDYTDLQYGKDAIGISGNIETKILKVPRFSLFGKTVYDYELSVIEYPEEVGYLADGILGMDFLLQFDKLNFDFENKFVHVIDTGRDWIKC
jgi:predicted aspartyl protease